MIRNLFLSQIVSFCAFVSPALAQDYTNRVTARTYNESFSSPTSFQISGGAPITARDGRNFATGSSEIGRLRAGTFVQASSDPILPGPKGAFASAEFVDSFTINTNAAIGSVAVATFEVALSGTFDQSIRRPLDEFGHDLYSASFTEITSELALLFQTDNADFSDYVFSTFQAAVLSHGGDDLQGSWYSRASQLGENSGYFTDSGSYIRTWTVSVPFYSGHVTSLSAYISCFSRVSLAASGEVGHANCDLTRTAKWGRLVGVTDLNGLALSASISSASGFNYANPNFGGAVPEPASWAMMIAGFGLVGGAMRHNAGRRGGHGSTLASSTRFGALLPGI